MLFAVYHRVSTAGYALLCLGTDLLNEATLARNQRCSLYLQGTKHMPFFVNRIFGVVTREYVAFLYEKDKLGEMRIRGKYVDRFSNC